MAKKRNKPKTPDGHDGEGQGGAPEPQPATRPAAWLRLVLGVWLVWHLFVVFVSPLSVQPASILVSELAQSPAVRWYSDPLYLNHGYHFFGPDPPINQVIRYRVTDGAGEVVAEGALPNKKQQWPRLYYHRHMMLADQASLGPPDVAPEEWLRVSMRAYGRHLLRRHDGARVELDAVRHLPLFPGQVLRGDDPNAAELFEPVASVDVSAAELDEPLAVPPPPDGAAESLPPGANR